MNKLILSIMLLAVVSQAADVAVEDDVYVLTDANFDEVIKSTENVLVEFYAPWCGHCKKLTPEYAKAAGSVKDLTNLKLAKVDATEAKDLAAKFQIKGFPTLKFFKNGNPSDYQGGRTADAIAGYCRKKSGPAVTVLEN